MCSKILARSQTRKSYVAVYNFVFGYRFFLPQCKEAAVKYDTKLNEHAVLLEKIGDLIPSCLRQGLTNHYWYLH